jgi:hypothetical protein
LQITNSTRNDNVNKNLAAYLNDHLAGSIAAIELMDDLIKASDDESLKRFLAGLKAEIESDQKILEKLIERADEDQKTSRKVAAWLSEKAARMKFKAAGEDFGGLGLVQALEMLALGIRGKELLWRALSKSSAPVLRDLELTDLEQRAIEQQQRVEDRRVEAAKAAFDCE